MITVSVSVNVNVFVASRSNVCVGLVLFSSEEKAGWRSELLSSFCSTAQQQDTECCS